MKHRLRFAGKKLIRMLLLLLGVSLAAFLLMSASPLDPLQTNVGQAALGAMSQEQIAQLEDYWGVNTPLPERYLSWLSDALHGDLGTSLLYRQPVLTIIGERLGNSLGLLLFAWALSGILGFTLGGLAGAFRGRWPDRLIRGWCLLISSTPAFWLAILLLLVFSVWLGVGPHRSVRPHRGGCGQRHLLGASPPRRPPRPHPQHHRGVLHCPSTPGRR